MKKGVKQALSERGYLQKWVTPSVQVDSVKGPSQSKKKCHISRQKMKEMYWQRRIEKGLYIP